jgi:hypothetical protein
MSLEMRVFLQKQRVPTKASWQAAVDSLGLPLHRGIYRNQTLQAHGERALDCELALLILKACRTGIQPQNDTSCKLKGS